mmetsp:Transcript_27114/g.54535  ORF Transcript_27114/g.54535 Transcript_27114/m.54535 type:complete len:84 (-) Transcript_27114:1448-1699(-)
MCHVFHYLFCVLSVCGPTLGVCQLHVLFQFLAFSMQNWKKSSRDLKSLVSFLWLDFFIYCLFLWHDYINRKRLRKLGLGFARM